MVKKMDTAFLIKLVHNLMVLNKGLNSVSKNALLEADIKASTWDAHIPSQSVCVWVPAPCTIPVAC